MPPPGAPSAVCSQAAARAPQASEGPPPDGSLSRSTAILRVRGCGIGWPRLARWRAWAARALGLAQRLQDDTLRLRAARSAAADFAFYAARPRSFEAAGPGA
eukprot:8238194-Alexandrium_andersonii.AAC.1